MFQIKKLIWIDFHRSFLAFLTTAEQSYGRFNLEAICTICRNNRQETYCLGAQVSAGKVYGAEDLMLSPPYTFQIVASEIRHKIFRNYVSWYDEREEPVGENWTVT